MSGMQKVITHFCIQLPCKVLAIFGEVLFDWQYIEFVVETALLFTSRLYRR